MTMTVERKIPGLPEGMELSKKTRTKYEDRQMNFDLRRPGTVHVIPSQFFEGNEGRRTSLDELTMIAHQNQSGYILDKNALDPDTSRYGLRLDENLYTRISSGETILIDYVGNTVSIGHAQRIAEQPLEGRKNIKSRLKQQMHTIGNRLRTSRSSSRNR